MHQVHPTKDSTPSSCQHQWCGENSIQHSAEAMKRNDGEPTYTLILGSCPEAVKNPDTDEPVDKKRLYQNRSRGVHESHGEPKNTLRAPNRCPKDAQEIPKSGQETPKSAQKMSKTYPKDAQSLPKSRLGASITATVCPRASQEHQKGAKRPSRVAKRRPRVAKKRPSHAQKTPRAFQNRAWWTPRRLWHAAFAKLSARKTQYRFLFVSCIA